MEELTSANGRNPPRLLQQMSRQAERPEGNVYTYGRQQAMGLKGEASSLPPLIDFGDDDTTPVSTHTSSRYESTPDDLRSAYERSSSSLSSISPAESSSGKPWNARTFTASSQRLVFDGPEFFANGNGDRPGNLSNPSKGKAGILSQRSSPLNTDLLSDFFESSSSDSLSTQECFISSPQSDLLSSNGVTLLDSALSTPCTPHHSLKPLEGLDSLPLQTPLCGAWPTQGLSYVSSQSPYPSKASPQDTGSVSSDWPSCSENPFDRILESPLFVPKAEFDLMKDSFANMSVADDEQDVWSWPSIPFIGDQKSTRMQTLPYQDGTKCNGEGLDISEHGSSVIDNSKSLVPDSSELNSGNQCEIRPKGVYEEDAFSGGPLISHEDNRGQESGSDSSDAGPLNTRVRISSEWRTTDLEESTTKMHRAEEFVGAGGGKGIFRAPVRGTFYPEGPVSLELRPQPLNESQTNQPTRVLISTDTCVWSGCDIGIMVWDIHTACELTCDGRNNMKGDEDAAAYSMLPVHGSALTCLFSDIANSIVWSGHKDGSVRAWSVLFNRGNGTSSSHEDAAVLTWQAHQTSVLSIVVTSYGELWTGSENGSLRAWPWDVIAHALSSSGDSIHNMPSTVAASYIDLRSRGAAAGASSLINSDVRFLIAEHSTCRVWSGGSYLLALWDARTRDILKLFGPNADPEFSSPSISPVRETVRTEEVKVNLAKVPKKEKSQGALSFFQRSRNAVMGAADAVLRAAVGGQIVDDSKKMEALVAVADGKVWVGYANGSLVQWDSSGNRLAEIRHTIAAVRCMCTFGNRFFVGYADGMVHVLAMESGNLLGAWRADKCGVAKLGITCNHLFTLADHGGIRGWFLMSPSPFDAALHSRMMSKEANYITHENLKILGTTWNVGQEKASFQSLRLWLGNWSDQASIIVVGLQEVEMGAGALAMAAAKETVGLAGSVNGQWWLDNVGHVLKEGITFERVASRQLAGLLIGAWVKKSLLRYVGGVDVAAVACGFGRAFGNKGAVAVKMMVFRRTVCVVNCHFAAHMDAVAKRNADFEHIYHRMAFGRSLGVGVAATAMAASAVQIIRGNNVRQDTLSLDSQDISPAKASAHSLVEDQSEDVVLMPELSEADMLIWVGDFNYRLNDFSYRDAVDLIAHKQWDELLNKDQLRTEMKAGRVFQGMREAAICFPPTYKFDKGFNGSGASSIGYDSGEKRRVPAWCDRILFRDSFDGSDLVRKPCLSRPMAASVAWYSAVMDAVESDHKPVSCLFDVEIAVINEAARRWEYGKFMRTDPEFSSFRKELDIVPGTVVNTNNLKLVDWNMSVLTVTYECGNNLALFNIYCEGKPTGASCPCKGNHSDEAKNKSWRGCRGFPSWLQVLPASGVLQPRHTVEISVQYAGRDTVIEDDISWRQQTCWDDREQEKAIVLVVEVKGILSGSSKQHRVCVCHSSSHDALQHGGSQNFRQRKFLDRSELLTADSIDHDPFN